jgi:hypothetical protein
MFSPAVLRRVCLGAIGALAIAWPVAPRADQAAAPAPTTPAPAAATTAQPGLPALSNAEFWRLATDLSEPDGTFHSENLVSNELRFQTIIPALLKAVTPGRVYLGVGSEQNFTYIAATRPTHAFLLDIRRGNTDLHLLYKAFFELSADRAEFVSRVFARPRPAGLTASSSAADIFAAFSGAAPSKPLFDRNLEAAITHLTKTHGFALSAGDRDGMAYVYNAWFTAGPDIRYQLNGGGGGGGGRGGFGGGTTYAALMTTDDGTGRNRSYLASEESFRFLKTLHTRNRIVPIVGNFGGSKALRAIATYLKQNQLVVSTFYTSNVQQYLRQDGLWDTFCASAATLPMDATSTMIFSERGGFQGAPAVPNGGFRQDIQPLRAALSGCQARR